MYEDETDLKKSLPRQQDMHRESHVQAAINAPMTIHFLSFQSFGNHEFDNGVEGIIPFLRNITFPVVCANLNSTRDDSLKDLTKKSVVVTVRNQKIGIVGYLTKEAPILSNTGQLMLSSFKN